MGTLTGETLELLAPMRGFKADALSADQAEALRHAARAARLDAVLMTGIAGSGHPGGALSSMDIYITLMAAANITPQNADAPDRDRIAISHGHTSAGVYAALAAFGFFDRDDCVANFRRAGSPFQGHIEREIPGVEWGTGNLGQGLAAGVGFALADRACGRESSRVFVVMGDGEQPKGQLAEARRVAAKERLSNITALIDANGIQICGSTRDIMPVNIALLWAADGWNVLECDGHDFPSLYDALRRADASDLPTVIICRTVMGKGVSFMEGTAEYHGKTASGDNLIKAVEELGGRPEEIDILAARRLGALPALKRAASPAHRVMTGEPRTYSMNDKKDGRGAVGAAISDVALACKSDPACPPVLAFDCDLAGSVKLDIIAKASPESFIELGIQEHAAATIAGAAAAGGALAVWADFGVFAIDETFNQQRLNDINHTPIKVVMTHVGLDVGEDGMTHQCIDYVGAFRNFFGWRVIVPADPNQADRAARWMMACDAPVAIAVGRGVTPIITAEDGSPFYGGDYQFEYGAIDMLRDGSDAAILAMGQIAVSALEAADALRGKGIKTRVLCCASPLGMSAERLLELVGSRPLVTVEDHHADTGIGSIAAMAIARAGAGIKLRTLGVTRYGESGKASEVKERMGLAPSGIAAAVESLL